MGSVGEEIVDVFSRISNYIIPSKTIRHIYSLKIPESPSNLPLCIDKVENSLEINKTDCYYALKLIID